MGIGATLTQERVAASLGRLPEPAAPRFEASDDVSGGGVLMALPALLSIGLLRHTRKFFVLQAGYYGIESIFLTLAFIALARIRSLEALRYEAPGEWDQQDAFQISLAYLRDRSRATSSAGSVRVMVELTA